MARNLYLLLNNLEETTFVSAAGVALYQVSTSKSRILRRRTALHIRRPADDESDRVVAEVRWSRWPGLPTIVRSNAFNGKSQQLQLRKFLYRPGSGGSQFNSTRYFLGNDKRVYRWRVEEGAGFVLTNLDTGAEVARFGRNFVRDGFFSGERKSYLQLQPSTLDTDIIVLTFVIMEQQRRDRAKSDASTVLEGDCEGGV